MHLPTSPRLSLCFSLACNASLPSVLRLHCAARRRHGRRHGAIVMAILQYQYPDTATKRQQPMPHHSTPLTPLLSFSLSPSSPNRSLHLWLNMYVLILHRSPAFFFYPSFFLSFSLKSIRFHLPPSDHPYVSLFSSSSVISLPFFHSFLFSMPFLSPPPLHVFFFLSFFSLFFCLRLTHSLHINWCIWAAAYKTIKAMGAGDDMTVSDTIHNTQTHTDTDTLAWADSQRCLWVNIETPLQNHPYHINSTKHGLWSRRKHLHASNSRNDTESHIQRFLSEYRPKPKIKVDGYLF